MEYESVEHDEQIKQVVNEKDDTAMPIINHLEEFRKRLIISLITVGFCSMISYYFAEELVGFITAPAGKLYYMQPAEAFFTYMKVSIFVGFLVSVPMIVYQGWAFLVPALTIRERAIAGTFIPSIVLLFFIGIAFSYFLVLPTGIRFFLGFATNELQPLLSVGNYLDFVIMFILPFGFVFELPLVLVILARLGLITSQMLIAKRNIVIFGAFVVGAIISPPEVFSQVMIAIPMIVLYEVGIFIIKYIMKK